MVTIQEHLQKQIDELKTRVLALEDLVTDPLAKEMVNHDEKPIGRRRATVRNNYSLKDKEKCIRLMRLEYENFRKRQPTGEIALNSVGAVVREQLIKDGLNVPVSTLTNWFTRPMFSLSHLLHGFKL